MGKAIKFIALCILSVIIAGLTAWASLAIYYSNLSGESVRSGIAIGFAVGAVVAFLLFKNRLRTSIGFMVIPLFATLIIVMPISSQGACDEDKSSLTDAIWRWQGTVYNNDTESVSADPDRFTLTLQSDGKVSIRADCNRGGGTYILDEKKLSITITHTTRAACPPGSLEKPYIRDLNGVAGWFFKEGDLYLDIKFDTGTMKFSK
jgi:heat shock protein HslJ